MSSSPTQGAREDLHHPFQWRQLRYLRDPPAWNTLKTLDGVPPWRCRVSEQTALGALNAERYRFKACWRVQHLPSIIKGIPRQRVTLRYLPTLVPTSMLGVLSGQVGG